MKTRELRVTAAERAYLIELIVRDPKMPGSLAAKIADHCVEDMKVSDYLLGIERRTREAQLARRRAPKILRQLAGQRCRENVEG